MKPSLRLALLLAALHALAPAARAGEYFLDDVGEALSFRAFDGHVHARISGTLDLEVYQFSNPSPALIYDDGAPFIQPRLTVFLDLQIGREFYVFAQARADQGFDPGDDGQHLRLDEYAVRYTPLEDGRLNFQLGKFATVTSAWIARHGSWDNPFVTAPLTYENLTGLWNIKPAPDSRTVLKWAHVRPDLFVGDEFAEKPNRTPIVWGPSYASGAAVFGRLGRLDYAAELKNVSLSSHPDTWSPGSGSEAWRHPAAAGRVGWRPDARWNLGLSATSGPYLEPDAAPLLAPGRDLGDYRQLVLAHDISFAWRHLQLWAEIHAARFEIPGITNADTLAAYIEAKYKFPPRLALAARVNRQVFATIPDGLGGHAKWGRDTWRFDLAPGYRPTPHTQVKLQYSIQLEDGAPRATAHSAALQFTVRL